MPIIASALRISFNEARKSMSFDADDERRFQRNERLMIELANDIAEYVNGDAESSSNDGDSESSNNDGDAESSNNDDSEKIVIKALLRRCVEKESKSADLTNIFETATERVEYSNKIKHVSCMCAYRISTRNSIPHDINGVVVVKMTQVFNCASRCMALEIVADILNGAFTFIEQRLALTGWNRIVTLYAYIAYLAKRQDFRRISGLIETGGECLALKYHEWFAERDWSEFIEYAESSVNVPSSLQKLAASTALRDDGARCALTTSVPEFVRNKLLRDAAMA